MTPDRSRIPALALAALLAAVTASAGCDAGGREDGPALPTESALADLYGTTRATADLNGNVVDVRVRQDPTQLERGGRLWAKVGPYIYLFSPQTQELFARWPGVAAVRVRTVVGEGEWVAEATLRRDALNAITWKDARRVVARARTEGTDKPGLMEDLVDYGEDRTDFRYNPDYVEGAP